TKTLFFQGFRTRYPSLGTPASRFRENPIFFSVFHLSDCVRSRPPFEPTCFFYTGSRAAGFAEWLSLDTQPATLGGCQRPHPEQAEWALTGTIGRQPAMVESVGEGIASRP